MNAPGKNGPNPELLIDSIERIERLMEEKKAIQSDIKDIFDSAKAQGLSIPTMKIMIKIRGRKRQDLIEEWQMIESYGAAMQMDLFGMSGNSETVN